jgi:hypothetical protein
MCIVRNQNEKTHKPLYNAVHFHFKLPMPNKDTVVNGLKFNCYVNKQ